MALIGFQQKVVPEVVVASKKVYVENDYATFFL